MKQIIFSLAFVISFVLAQQQGSQKQEYHPQLTLQTCTKSGGCTSQNKKVVMDSNWRWTHQTSGYQNCYNGNTWDTSSCPDPVSCAQNCALEGVDQTDMKGTYGIDSDGNTLTLRFVTRGAYSTNIGSRMYLLNDDDNYYMFKLLNREFTFDVDVSNLPCGLNGALYFSEMQKDGGKSYSGNKCGARYGTGYCDAQCPHDIKFINGEANVKDWKPSPSDPNSGSGHYGSCCPEMDIWEGNSASNAYTVHGCQVESQSRCEGTNCGDNDKGERFKGVCDKDGCDFNPFRQGDHSFYGSGSNFKIDTTKSFTVVTQFITTDGTDNGQLKEVRRLYVQNGKVIANSKTSISGMQPFDSLTDDYCNSQKSTFGDINDFKVKGGMKKMGEALGRGMVLVMSLWDDHEANMLWLDSNYPLTKDPSQPGVARGSCSTSSGVPKDVESQYPNSSVKYGNIKVGEIDSTYNGGSSCPGGSLSACISLCPSEASAYKACVQECMQRCSSSEKSEIFLG